jgi:hypothetical protein
MQKKGSESGPGALGQAQGEQLTTDVHCVPQGCWNRWKPIDFHDSQSMIEPVPK